MRVCGPAPTGLDIVHNGEWIVRNTDGSLARSTTDPATTPPLPWTDLLGPSPSPDFGRPFALIRDKDVSDVSGTGHVADGVLFADGHAAIHWTGSAWPTTTPHPGGMQSVLAIHGHDGLTRVVWDQDGAARNELAAARTELASLQRRFEDLQEEVQRQSGVHERTGRRASTIETVMRAFAADMRTWASPHGVATDYADRLEDALNTAVNSAYSTRPVPPAAAAGTELPGGGR